MKHTNVTIQEYLDIIRDNMLYFEKQKMLNENQDSEMRDESQENDEEEKEELK